LDGVLVVYSLSSLKSNPPQFSIRRHLLAFSSMVLCLCVYVIARHLMAQSR
jgi:hypothetical protein